MYFYRIKNQPCNMKSFLILTALLLNIFFATTVTSQTQQTLSSKNKKALEQYKNGELFFVQEKYQQALQCFETAKRIDPSFVEAYFMCAEIYRDVDNYQETYNNISAAVGLDSTMFVTGYYHAGVALCHLGQFDDAMQWFALYQRFTAGRKQKYDSREWIRRAMVAKELIEHPVPFHPEHISPLLISDYDMYWPSITLDEEEICFTVLVPRDTIAFKYDPHMSKNSQNFHEDFYTSRNNGAQWQAMKPAVGINTPSNEGAQALSADGQWMFFTACGRQDSKGSCDIYFSRRTSRGWSTPVNIGQPVNTPYWESQPCFSADGKTLYFVSNRPGGKGKNDIYSATIVGMRDNGVPIFGNVTNLGDSINTKGDETSPFIHPDDKTLYFSSDGWPGIGKLDIFYSRRSDEGAWMQPTNIGYPINTSQDDNGLVVNARGTTAYYASARIQADGYTKREIMKFDLPSEARPEAVSYIKGFVYDARTRLPLMADLELIDLSTGKCTVTAQSEDMRGTFVVNLPSGKDYALIANKSGYLLHSQNFELTTAEAGSSTTLLDIPLSPLVAGEKVSLRNVFFDYNSTALRAESFIELDKLAEIMRQNPQLRIEIGGHTDSDGSAAYNQKLSMGRAASTVDYIVSQGIEASRLTAVGYGLTQPCADNNTEEGKALNRRIEAKIIE